jgi:predicted TIM-barrel fold metal-dependent hydrolase
VGNPWFTDAAEVLYKNENVLADISGLTLGAFAPRYAALVARRLAEVAAYLDRADKLMFGTDWPICPMDDYLAFARSLEMSEAELDGLLAGNAARLFGFQE